MTIFDAVTSGFLFEFLTGLRLNMVSAILALLLVLPLAFLCAWGLHAGPRALRRLVRIFKALMHATPVFIAMFFLAGMLGDGAVLPTAMQANLPLVILVLGSAPFVFSYGINQFGAMIRKRSEGDHRAALLIVPGLGRAMQVLISTSCLGAAIGVPEAMSVVMFTSEQIPDPGNRILFLAIAGVLFVLAQRVVLIPFRVLHVLLERQLRRGAVAEV